MVPSLCHHCNTAFLTQLFIASICVWGAIVIVSALSFFLFASSHFGKIFSYFLIYFYSYMCFERKVNAGGVLLRKIFWFSTIVVTCGWEFWSWTIMIAEWEWKHKNGGVLNAAIDFSRVIVIAALLWQSCNGSSNKIASRWTHLMEEWGMCWWQYGNGDMSMTV